MSALFGRIFGRGGAEAADPLRLHASLRRRIDPGRAIAETGFVALRAGRAVPGPETLASLGAMKLRGGRIMPGKAMTLRLDADAPTGEAPSPRAALEGFVAFAGDAVLVGHDMGNDLALLSKAMKAALGTPLRSPAVDTLSLHAWLMKNEPRLARQIGASLAGQDLISMARGYGIEVIRTGDLFYEAFYTAQLFQRFLHYLAQAGIVSLGGLLRAGKPA